MAVSERWVERVVEEWRQKVARILGIPVPEFKIKVVDNETTRGGGAAHFDPETGTMVVGSDIDPDDPGAIIHEMVHAAQTGTDGRGSEAKPKQVEALADAVRFKLGLTPPGWQLTDAARRFVEMDDQQLRRVARRQLGTETQGQSAGESPGQGTPPIMNSGQFGPESQGGSGGSTGAPGQPIDPALAAILERLAQGQETEEQQDWEFLNWGEARAQNLANMRAIVSAFGIGMTPTLDALTKQAWREEWNEAMFLEELRGTKEYRQRFPGIFKNDGTLKMSEQEYLQTEKQYEAYATQYGIAMGPKRMAWLFRNNVTPERFADRGEAHVRLRRNKDLYAAFKKEIAQAGLAKPADLQGNKALFKWIMGQGNPKWNDLWQDTITRNAAIQAGITINKNSAKYTSLGQKAIEKISSMDLSEDDMAQKFVQLGEVLGTVLPMTEAGTYGVRKQTALQATFGGKKAVAARKRIQRALDTYEAFQQDRAASAVFADERGRVSVQGVTDPMQRSESEY